MMMKLVTNTTNGPKKQLLPLCVVCVCVWAGVLRSYDKKKGLCVERRLAITQCGPIWPKKEWRVPPRSPVLLVPFLFWSEYCSFCER